jgi:hypothetical protein
MKIHFLVSIALIGMAIASIGTVGIWIAVRLASVRVTEVRFFHGPQIASFFDGLLTFGCIPLSGYVKYDVPQLRKKPWPARLSVAASPLFVLLPIAIGLLGWKPAGHHLASGFGQAFFGALHPFTTAQELLTQLHGVFLISPMTATGIVTAKAVSASLLPFGGWALSQCLSSLVKLGDEEDSTGDWYFVPSIFCTMALHFSWMIAVVTYAFAKGS